MSSHSSSSTSSRESDRPKPPSLVSSRSEGGKDKADVFSEIRRLQLPPRPVQDSSIALPSERDPTAATVAVLLPQEPLPTSAEEIPVDVLPPLPASSATRPPAGLPQYPAFPVSPHPLTTPAVATETSEPPLRSGQTATTSPSPQSQEPRPADTTAAHSAPSSSIEGVPPPVIALPLTASSSSSSSSSPPSGAAQAEPRPSEAAVVAAPSVAFGDSAADMLPSTAIAVTPTALTGALDEPGQRFNAKVDVDFFIDPRDPRNIATSLETPEQRREQQQREEGQRQPQRQAPVVVQPAEPQQQPPPPRQGEAPRPTQHTATLRRSKSEWEKTGDVPLFANSSDEGEADGEVSFSDGSFTTGGDSDGAAHRDPFRHIGTKRDASQTPVCGDGVAKKDGTDDGAPFAEEAAAQRSAEQHARERKKRRLAKESAKRIVYTTLENRAASASSVSQQGVSVSSVSSGLTPQQRRKAESRRHRDADSRSAGLQKARDETGSDEEVRVDVPTAPPDAGMEGDRRDSIPEAAPAPYVPSLRGPVSALKAVHAADAGSVSESVGLFLWRPSVAPQTEEAATHVAPGDTTPPASSSPLSSLSPAPVDAQQAPLANPCRGATLRDVLSVTIRGMSPLHADAGVVHPFVRVWFVNCVTGENLIQSDAAVPCAITHPYDLRSHGSRSPWWEAEIAVRLDPDLVRRSPKTGVLLFEVLDCGNENVFGFFIPRTGLYPICWGFLMLNDCFGFPNVLFTDNVHVQLYRYPLRTSWYVQWLQYLLPPCLSSSAIYAPTSPHMDESGVLSSTDAADEAAEKTALAESPFSTSPTAVFSFFKDPFNRRLTYDGGLVVTVKAPRKSAYTPKPTNMLPYEEYLLHLLVAGGGSCAVPRRDSSAPALWGDPNNPVNHDVGPLGAGGNGRMRAMMRSMSIVNQHALGQEYARQEGERVLLPTASLQTVPVPGLVTCITFFHNSPILVLGVTRNLQYIVELRNTLQPDLPVLAQMLGHTGHIHSVAVQKEDRFALACSADKTVRLWRVTDLSLSILAMLEGGSYAPNTAQVIVEPLCVLPHAYPVYSAIFHQDTVVTAGYSTQLQVWRYDRLLSHERLQQQQQQQQQQSGGHAGGADFALARRSPSQLPLSPEMASSLQLTATFTPGLNVADPVSLASGSEQGSMEPTRQQLGELIFTTETESDGLVLSVASNENSGRVWSVSSGGTVYCWRALYEAVRKGKRRDGDAERGAPRSEGSVWQMSVRHRSDCAGASRVEVAGTYAVVTCRKSPVVYVFDATTCELVRVVNTRLVPNTPIHLLPDGEVFVAGTSDGGLVAWDCTDGVLCTPWQGDYNAVKTKFPIVGMAWAQNQQLAALQSPAPCPEGFLPTYGIQPSLASPAATSMMTKNAHRFRVPTEVTLIAIVGTARSACSPIVTSDRSASLDFCARCGGDVDAKRKALQQTLRTRALRSQQAEHKNRKTFLYNDSKTPLGFTTSVLPDTALLFGGPGDSFIGSARTFSESGQAPSPDLDYTSAGLKINSILNFWRGLVRQHRRTATANNSDNDDGRSAGHHGNPPGSQSHAQRTNRYLVREMESRGREGDGDTLSE